MTAQTNLPPFHLAFPVRDRKKPAPSTASSSAVPRAAARPNGSTSISTATRSSPTAPSECGHKATSAVDSHNVPVRHFGAVLSMEQWEDMAKRLTDAGTEFVIEPYIRFKGEVGEQATMFFLDPSGNALEFKAFKNLDSLFAK